MPVIEIEINSALNRDLMFAPTSERVRGRVDFVRIKEKEAFELTQAWPRGVPGQVIGWDTDRGEGYIRDRLDEPEWADVKAKIEKELKQTSSPRRALGGHGRHAPTMLHWMRRAVEGGHATVIAGRLPDELPGEPTIDFYRVRDQVKGTDTKPLKTLLALMYAKLPEKEQRAFKEALEAAS